MEAKKPRPILKKIKTLIQGDNSLKVKKNSSGGKTYKKRGEGSDGSTLRMKLKTRGEEGRVTSVNVRKEKGMFGGKTKTIKKANPVEMLSENGSAYGMNVKSKTISKAPGIFGKRTVKRETKFVESTKGDPMKKAPKLNAKIDISSSNSMRDSQRRDMETKNQERREKRQRVMAGTIGVASFPLKKVTR